ncbi:MAG TPA: TonB family protein [Thermoanaerobaculia bacterium]|nr:TonB family protein [Thermoanaerobaculia bacterium]
MRSREEFGKYLLLKKLSEDPLGETFRAARGGGQDVEQVVLLRVFNGQRLDGDRLWQRISDRAGIQQALKNPNIGNGVDLGAERGVPFVAYDYISGRNLENLLIQASNTNSPIPLDHALLIVERMALALSAATETRAGDGRVVHGFAVPHLVMVSNEGETRVLGFEAAPGLAEQAGNFEPEISRYLAPEVIAGHPVDRSDDVFTLGAVLYELVACRPLPAAGGDWAGAIDSAQVAHDGTPLPPDVANLMRRSLAPRGQRIADSGDWHKALSQLMASGGYAATTFNLAFFMHNLFRHEIEQENQEIEEEKTMVMEAPLVAPAPQAAAPEAAEATGAGVATYEEEEKKGGKGALIGAVAALLLLAAAGIGWYFLAGPGAGEPEPEPVQVVEPEPEPEPPEPQGPSPEEIQDQLAEMIDARSDEMESKLREQYDERIRALQNELVEAEEEKKRVAAQREQQRLAEEEAAAEEAARLAQLEEERLAAEEAARQAKAEEDARKLAEQQEAAAEPEPPPPPKTKEGDLVTMAAGVSPPQLTTQPEARYPAMAKKLGREADVDVRVLVDERGNVREATLMSQKKAGFGFDEAALDAARGAKYRPATKDGVIVKMYVTLTIRFNL